MDALLAANPGIEPGTVAGDELDVLIDLIEHYESKQETFATPSALSAIAFRMEQAGLKPRDLIPFIGSRAKVSEVLSGKRPITLPMARALHKNLGIPADLLLADEPDDQETREWDRFPITALRHIGVITNKAFKSAEEAVRDLMKRAQCIDPLPMYRRNDHNRRNAKTDPYALEAWCLGVLAKSFDVVKKGSYRKGSVTQKTMASVAALSVLDDGPRKAQDYLASQHVALVVLPHLPQTHLDGAILSRSDNVPVIGMTLRYDRVDYFWFCLMHELAHLVRHLDKGLATEFFDDLSIAPMDLEKEADELATDILIPPDVWASSAAKADPTALSVCSLANAIGRSPAIVAGRVRHETKNFRLLTHFVGQGMVRKHFGDQWISKEQGRSSSSGPVKTGPSPVGSVADSRMSGTAKLPQVAEQSQGRQVTGLMPTKGKAMKKLTPGTPAPKSGQYLNPVTKTEVTAVKGKPLPATPKPKQGYVLVDKTKHKGG